jgi:hypothetical protein
MIDYDGNRGNHKENKKLVIFEHGKKQYLVYEYKYHYITE